MGFSFWRSFAAIALVEAALFLTIGGGMDISSSIFLAKARQMVFGSKKQWSAKEQGTTQQNAAKYVLSGVFVLAEAILLSRLGI